ncbi:MerR family DNA-binding transcriptional regulator [Rhodococcus pyridinivorans]|uniref:DNA polymerase sliding clamp subunit n=1 Tax=Rhodococcus pyridinivorans AK37 TaxID=1114960 RepID=H0JYK0_9NOCA|nr:MerR family DNA-binding transcriptional regulator [Rhodococcus pyridinivorans]EHK80445.1 DNA polymerase sliding clamp subunit [Rhodococcus pyridinivorans AK37]MCD2142396.1 MerR family DNA-binding transcriptional regulator [Rhodococcus pyridinivorans]
MTDPEMMSIGVFAELVGLTASALRFYDDAGLLRPEQVDPVDGIPVLQPLPGPACVPAAAVTGDRDAAARHR